MIAELDQTVTAMTNYNQRADDYVAALAEWEDTMIEFQILLHQGKAGPLAKSYLEVELSRLEEKATAVRNAVVEVTDSVRRTYGLSRRGGN